jgi:hypothetical protein
MAGMHRLRSRRARQAQVSARNPRVRRKQVKTADEIAHTLLAADFSRAYSPGIIRTCSVKDPELPTRRAGYPFLR